MSASDARSRAGSGASFVTHDAAFADVLGDAPRLARVIDSDAHEGPVYVPGEDALYFTSVPRRTRDGVAEVSIRRLALDGTRWPLGRGRVTTLRRSSNAANGMTLDLDGRHLLVCEQGTPRTRARIARLDPRAAESDAATVVDRCDGLPLNSPNDVAVHPDGSVWFTDPSYGFLQGFRPQPEAADFVYRHDRGTGAVTVVDDTFDKPNGIALSHDGATLYVADSGANQTVGSYHPTRPHHVVAFDVRGGHLRNRRLLAVITPGFPDGLTTDEVGRVYVSSFSGVQVFTPEGDRLGEIRIPGVVNFDFGGPDGNVLFATTDDAVWAAVLGTRGARAAARPREHAMKGA